MPSIKMDRITGITSPHAELLEALSQRKTDPSAVPLLKARIDVEQAPLHIEECLNQTFDNAPELEASVTNRMRASDRQELRQKLLYPITEAWNPSSGGRMSTSTPRGIIPRQLPQAIQDFRLGLK